MDSLGFHNFRKFVNLESLRLGKVNILVGENNSGKSTFTKAALLLSKFLDANLGHFDLVSMYDGGIRPRPFKFTDPEFKNVYIDTFYQALSVNSDSGVIKFYTQLDEFEIEVSISVPRALETSSYYVSFMAEHKSEPFVDVEQWSSDVYPRIREKAPKRYQKELSVSNASVWHIGIIDYKRSLMMNIDYENLCINMSFIDQGLLSDLMEIERKLSAKKAKDFEYCRLCQAREDLAEKIWASPNFVHRQFSCFHDDEEFHLIGRCLEFEREESHSEEHLSKIEIAEDSCRDLYRVLNNFSMEYIYAHSVHQLSTYKYDKGIRNDYVDQTVSMFYDMMTGFDPNSNDTGDNPVPFVEKWMNRLGIGERFEIETAKRNTALRVQILDNDTWLDLSSKGIGAIQTFLLLLRMATIIFDGRRHSTVVIEEPEQNLHPALQSRLADFFCDVSDKGQCQLLIETHSEYLVRRIQLIVQEKFCRTDMTGDNQFKVFYFPESGEPYDMSLLKTGEFERHFGKGFYDEASTLHREFLDGSKI